MPVNRNLLHKNHVDEFKAWLVANGFTLSIPRGIYEAVRIVARKPDNEGKGGYPAQVFYSRDRSDHLTIQNQTQLNLARRFLASRRK